MTDERPAYGQVRDPLRNRCATVAQPASIHYCWDCGYGYDPAEGDCNCHGLDWFAVGLLVLFVLAVLGIIGVLG